MKKIRVSSLGSLLLFGFIVLSAGNTNKADKNKQESQEQRSKKIIVLEERLASIVLTCGTTQKGCDSILKVIGQSSNQQYSDRAVVSMVTTYVKSKQLDKAYWVVKTLFPHVQLEVADWVECINRSLSFWRKIPEGIENFINYLEKTSEIKPEILYNMHDSRGQTALHAAVLSQVMQAVIFVVAKGSDLTTIKDSMGIPIIMFAARHSKDICAYLLELGLDPNTPFKDEKGNLQKPLDYALNDSVTTLINYGAAVNTQGKQNFASVEEYIMQYNKHNTFYTLQFELIKRLIENNCDVSNMSDKVHCYVPWAKELNRARTEGRLKLVVKNNRDAAAKLELWYVMACNGCFTDVLQQMYLADIPTVTSYNEYIDLCLEKIKDNTPALTKFIRAGWPVYAEKTMKIVNAKPNTLLIYKKLKDTCAYKDYTPTNISRLYSDLVFIYQN